MYTLFIPMILMCSLLFFFSMNPLAMGLILILQTIFLSLFLITFMKSAWFIYMFILIFIGGMLILFIYVTSIFPNEKFNFNQLKMIFFFILFSVLTVMLILYLTLLNFNFSFLECYTIYPSMENANLISTKKFFSSETNLLIIFLVNYLFFCMIVVIKITNFHEGPLRKMNYV
uniref:NADH-ubiquinone oxidoreductase chain 6 n=1 Tax=Lachesilla sp. LaspGHN TaxID=2597012 RepID=A0A8K1ZFZ8_9NEOP|nr:NADH dehydrogenase subunit 6 [Lachesilla sp. LaspGHN]